MSTSPPPKQPREARSRWRSALIALPVLAVMGGVLFLAVRRHIPPELMSDLRAGMAARGVRDPDQRLRQYLEHRYGPLEEPAHRKEAFLDFFNLDHIKALQLMVKHSPEAQRAANIQAMANWVASYRESLSPEERAELRAVFATPEGQVRLRQATAQYNSQDVYYRGQTAGVISELLNTIHSVQKP